MVGLIIALSLLPVRRISGQNAVVSILGLKTVPLEPQLEPSPVLSVHTTPEPPPKLSTNIQTENHVNLPPVTVGDRPKPLFLSQVTPERMAQPRNKTAQNTAESNANDTDRIVFIDDGDEENRVPPCTKPPPPPRHEVTTDGPVTPETAPKVNATEIELDERSSFDGDQCPTGYIRVNGKCVEKD